MAYNLSSVNTPAFPAGKFGSGLSSANGYYTYPTNFVPPAGTIEFWAKTTSTATMVAIGIDGPFWIGGDGGNASAAFNNNTFRSNIAISDGNWHHIAVTYGNGNGILWVDGVQGSTTTYGATNGPGSTSTNPLGIGGFGSGSYLWNGTVDEVRISSVIRYRSNFTPSASPFITDISTVALYHLDGDGSDAVATISGPTTISNLLYRFRASSMVGYSTGSVVSSTNFEIGNVTLTQSNSGNQPTYVASSIGTSSGLRFDGSTSSIGGNASNVTMPITMTTIFRSGAASGRQIIVDGSGFFILLNDNTPNTYAVYAGSEIYGGTTSTGAHVMTTSVDASGNSTLYVDGTLVASGYVNTGTLSRFILGVQNGTGFFNGDVCEILFYNKILTPTERTVIDTYIQTTYGIAMSDSATNASTSAPTAISGLTHRFRASQLTGLSNGVAVASAAFETGNITLTQATAANQPAYVSSSINGQAGLRFNGTSSVMTGSVSSAIPQSLTMTLIVKLSNATATQEVLYSGIEVILNDVTAGAYALSAGSEYNGGQVTTGNHAITIIMNSSGVHYMYVDGTVVLSGAAGNGKLDGYRLGNHSSITRWFNGDICEILTYNRALTASDRGILGTYIQNTYGITMADAGLGAITQTGSSISRFVRANDLTSLVLAITGIQNSNTQTASYTLMRSDVAKVIEMNVATSNTLTIPASATTAFPVGAIIDIAQTGIGQVTVVPASGVTLRSARGATGLYAQYSVVRLRQRALNEWVMYGDIKNIAVYDSFNRANSTSTLGNADSGQAWSAVQGTWGILNGTAYAPSVSDDDRVIVNSNLTDQRVNATITFTGNGTAGLIARSNAAGDTYYLANFSNSNANNLFKRVGGTYTYLTGIPLINSGDLVELGVVGPAITIKQNGTVIVSITDSAVTSGTYAGLRQSTNSTAYWDNFTVS